MDLAELHWLQVDQRTRTEKLFWEWLLQHFFELVPASALYKESIDDCAVFVRLDFLNDVEVENDFIHRNLNLSRKVLKHSGEE